MASLEAHLVDPELGADPAPDSPLRRRTAGIRGNIKGYLPGVRENGAQYTLCGLSGRCQACGGVTGAGRAGRWSSSRMDQRPWTPHGAPRNEKER